MGHRRTSYLERLANFNQDELLYEFAHAQPRQKSVPLALLLPEGHPTREAQLRCGTPKSRYDRAGRRIRGLNRCKLPECAGCQMRASKEASRRGNALVAAATLGAPDRDAISFVTVNAQDHDLAGFKKDLLGALKGTKGTARFQVGLTGLLHTHLVVIHEGLTRSALKDRLKKVFTQSRAVNGKKIEQEWLLDGVVAVTRYSMKPVKTRDFHRETPVTVEMVQDWVRVQNQIKGLRKMEWGLTQAERKVARDLFKKMKPKRTVKKRKKVNCQVHGELGFPFGTKSTQGWNVRLDTQGECDRDYSIYSEMNVNCPIRTLDQRLVHGGDTVIHTDLGKYPYTVVITGSPLRRPIIEQVRLEQSAHGTFLGFPIRTGRLCDPSQRSGEGASAGKQSSRAGQRGLDPLHSPGADAELDCDLAHALVAQHEGGPDLVLLLGGETRPPELGALSTGPVQTGLDAFDDERPFEFGKYSKHLIQGPPSRAAGIDSLLVKI